MGIWILDYLAQNGLMEDLSVLITGPRVEVGKRIAQRYGCRFSTDNAEAASSDFVVICTPLDLTPEVMEEVVPHLERGTVVMDICSVKTEVCDRAKKLIGSGIQYLSLHPMFGPSVKDLEGQVVILVPVRGRRFLNKIEKFLGEHQARTITTTPSMHDYALGVVQCLTHFAYITVGATLKDLDIDIKQSRSFSSPVYELMLDMIGRILSGNPAMYSEIQIHNPYSAEIEDLFLENAGRLKAAVDAGDSRAFQRIMIEAGKHYDDLDSAFSKSGRAVSALYEEYLKIKASAGRRVALRNEVTGAIHVGQIKGISGEHVTIGHGKRTQRLKVSNVSLLPDSESRRLRVEKFGTIQRDISLLFPDHADPGAIAGILEKCDGDLVSASVIDEYRGEGIPDALKSITLRLTIFGDLDVISAEKGAIKMLRSIGALER